MTTGKNWTVVSGLLTFVAILGSVWFYLYPRLFGEPLSAAAQIELRPIVLPATMNSEEMMGPSGKVICLSPNVVIGAPEIHSFRGFYGDERIPVLRLNLTETGMQRISEYLAAESATPLAVIVHGKLICVHEIREPVSRVLELQLRGVSRDDAEEAFARLTQ
jgi:hypothetical protein